MNNEDKFISLFPTGVMLVDMSNHPCKQIALDIIDSTETTNHQLVNKGSSSFDTSNILFHPSLEQLKNDIHSSVKKYATLAGNFPLVIANNWFNKMNHGGSVIPHRHEGSVISGAYYIRAPIGSSSLHFSSPLKPLRMYDLSNNTTKFNEAYHTIPCVEDLLVLFPSWLEHYTDENDNNERTVISFNTEYLK